MAAPLYSFLDRIWRLASTSNLSSQLEFGKARGCIGDGKVALLGCTVTPGFDFADYRSGNYEESADKWPAEAERIRRLTRS